MSVFGDPNAIPVLREKTVNHPLRPTEITCADGTKATAFPLTALDHIPISLLTHLCDEFNEEIERGQTYPLAEPLSVEAFTRYWLGDFYGVVLKGSLESFEKRAAEAKPHVPESQTKSSSDAAHLYQAYHSDSEREPSEAVKLLPTSIPESEGGWAEFFLGTFHILPNYPGRSSHICNCGFLTGSKYRGTPLKVGSTMGKLYLDWAPKLGYTYSVFNLVYETNEYSVRIWERLGFDKIGRVPAAGYLKGFDKPVDAILFGKQLV